MADDRMKKDDLDRNMAGRQGEGAGQPSQPGQPGQQTPGRNPNPEDEQFGKRGGQGTTPGGLEDDELNQGTGGRGGNIGNKPGGQGGQNR